MPDQNGTTPLTRAGYEEMRHELEYLRSEGRRQIAAELQAARDSEIDQDDDLATALGVAREMQEQTEARIMHLEQVLAHATVIDEQAARASDTVQIGSVVVVEQDGAERTYQIVSSVETDPDASKISDESPIGAALLGHRAGETVEVEAPAGRRALHVKELR
jgi:transcription elongation factor GreA